MNCCTTIGGPLSFFFSRRTEVFADDFSEAGISLRLPEQPVETPSNRQDNTANIPVIDFMEQM
jgi:hypothetical protein